MVGWFGPPPFFFALVLVSMLPFFFFFFFYFLVYVDILFLRTNTSSFIRDSLNCERLLGR